MDKVKNFVNYIPKPFKNKYVITLLAFAFWIIFIDDYNLIKQYQLHKNIQDLESQKTYYLSEIEKDSTKFHLIQSNQEEQEKFAREKFLMKKNNEDLFILRKKNE